MMVIIHTVLVLTCLIINFRQRTLRGNFSLSKIYLNKNIWLNYLNVHV